MTQPASGSPVPAPGRSLGPVLALDLGGTQLRTAVVDAEGRVSARLVSRTPQADASTIVRACVEQLSRSRAAANAQGLRPKMLGISAPGPLDPRHGVLIDPPNLDRSLWEFPLADTLAEQIGLPAVLERDTQVAALGEGMFGAARGLSDYVYLTVSTGVGGAIVSGGQLLRGPDGLAGELGHLSVAADGPPCGCGARGHLETFSSGTGIVKQARAAWQAGEIRAGTPLAELISQTRDPQRSFELEGRDVARAEEQGDLLATAIMHRARDAFAVALVSIVDVFNPQRVIVGGGVAAGQGERLLGPARQRVRREAFRRQAARVEIVPAALGDDVGLIGTLPLTALPRLEPHAMSERSFDLPREAPKGEHLDEEQASDGATVLKRRRDPEPTRN